MEAISTLELRLKNLKSLITSDIQVNNVNSSISNVEGMIIELSNEIDRISSTIPDLSACEDSSKVVLNRNRVSEGLTVEVSQMLLEMEYVLQSVDHLQDIGELVKLIDADTFSGLISSCINAIY
jgi:methyl-accepting chemotaxis protein